MVNVVNVRRVADAIERHEIADLGFNMGAYFDQNSRFDDKSGHDCGTTACIGGWACAVSGRLDEMKSGSRFSEFYVAQDFLGLFEDDAYDLMVGRGFEEGASQAQAVRTLRHLADTYERTGVGEVRWDFDAEPALADIPPA